MPSFKMKRREDHYELDVVAPGISAEQLKVELHNRHLSIYHFMNYTAPDHTNAEMGAPNIIHLMQVPFDVELEAINAVYDQGRLKVIMPFNEMAEGYHREIEIDKR